MLYTCGGDFGKLAKELTLQTRVERTSQIYLIYCKTSTCGDVRTACLLFVHDITFSVMRDTSFVCLKFLENQILIVAEYQFCLYFVLFFFNKAHSARH